MAVLELAIFGVLTWFATFNAPYMADVEDCTELFAALGEAIRRRRVGENWSHSEAARRAGMGLRAWQRRES